MATKKISELEAITEADDSDVLAIVDVSEGKTNKITKNNLLIGAGHSIEMSLNQETYALTLTLKNAAGTELSTASIDLPNENSITDISYNNGKLTLTKQSGATTEVDISGLIEGLATETALNNLANALKETIGIQTNTYDNTKTYNTGDIVVQNEKIYKCKEDNITGTFDSSKWDEISLYEYQKLQDEAIENNYKVVTKLQEENEDLKKNQLTYTPTPATSHYLQDSADSRFRKFIPIGRSVQDGDPTPKNPVPIKNTGDNVNEFDESQLLEATGWTKNNGVYSGTIDSWFAKFKNGFTGLSFKENIQYAIAFKGYTTGGTPRIKIVYTDGKSSMLEINATSMTEYSIISTVEKTISSIQADFGSGSAQTLSLTEFKIEQGTKATPYSPYGCGNVNEKVQNKNLIDVSYTKENPLNINGSFATINLDLQADKVKNIIKAGDTIRLSCKAISNGGTITRSQLYLGNGTNTSYLPASMITITNQESTISNYGTMQNDIVETGTHQLMVVMYASSGENYKVYDFMLEKVESNGEVTYVPHAEQNRSFPLAQGQKFYEGSYPDDDEKVHHKMGESVLDGTENITIYTTSTSIPAFNIPINNMKIISNTQTKFPYLCNSYTGTTQNAIYETDINGISTRTNQSAVLIKNKDITTLEGFKTYLAEQYANGTPVEVVYQLAEEQTEDFTEEQKTAYPEWKKARTYKNVTHISSEDETPANVDITYVRDLETVINNLTTRVETIESEV